MTQQLQELIENLRRLGWTKLTAMAAALFAIIALVVGGSWFISQPSFETLYIGLERDDVNRMGIVLSEAKIAYDIDSSGGTFLVEVGQASRARMILAEKGLPGSANAGYELFDKLGTLGLTSFMQEVTRVRALEGEIARSIQSLSEVKAARVHLVVPDRNSFIDRDRRPTASVLIRTNGSDLRSKAEGIRHLVAAAVPGLSRSDVTVLDASGEILASGEDKFGGIVSTSLDLEKGVEANLLRKVSDALKPHIGIPNFRLSVNVELDTDRRQTEETIYDPESRVERSVQVVRTEDSSSQADSIKSTTVEQNIPTDTALNDADTANKTVENSERREETTNYEINTKKVAVVSNGYSVRRLSIALVINRDTLMKSLQSGNNNIDDRLEQIRELVSVAAGFKKDRGDSINVTAIDFIVGQDDLETNSTSYYDGFKQYINTIIKALALIITAGLVTFYGLRPLAESASSKSQALLASVSNSAEGPSSNNLPKPVGGGMDDYIVNNNDGGPSTAKEGDDYLRVLRNQGMSAKERLDVMVEFDSERTVQILRRWLNEAA